MTILVTIDQLPNGSSPPPGIPGQAREDLHVDGDVILTATGGEGTYTWALLDAPTSPDVQSDSAAVITPTTGVTVNITPDYDGTYYGTVTDGIETVEWSFYAGEPLGDLAGGEGGEFFPRRVPAFREGMAHNVPDAIDRDGNRKGWSREWRRWFAAITELWRIVQNDLVATTDSRLSDDRTASGLRDTTGIVSVSGATAPGVGQYLIATDATHATWQSLTIPAQKSWHVLLNVDFTLRTTQNVTGNGNFVIPEGGDTGAGEVTLVVENFADIYSGNTMGILAGSGLRMVRCTAGTADARTCPVYGWRFPVSIVNGTPVRVTAVVPLAAVYVNTNTVVAVDYPGSGGLRAGSGVYVMAYQGSTSVFVDGFRKSAGGGGFAIGMDDPSRLATNSDVIGIVFPFGVAWDAQPTIMVGSVATGGFIDPAKLVSTGTLRLTSSNPLTKWPEVPISTIGQSENWGVTLCSQHNGSGPSWITKLKIEAFY